MRLCGPLALRIRVIGRSRSRTFAARLLPATACTTSYEEDDENRSDQRRPHPHCRVRWLSKPRARALGRRDLKCQTRARRPPGRTPRTTPYTPDSASAGSRSRTATARDCPASITTAARNAARVAAAAVPARRTSGDDETVGSAETAVVPNAERWQALALAGSSPSTIRICRTSSGCPSPATMTSARTAAWTAAETALPRWRSRRRRSTRPPPSLSSPPSVPAWGCTRSSRWGRARTPHLPQGRGYPAYRSARMKWT